MNIKNIIIWSVFFVATTLVACSANEDFENGLLQATDTITEKGYIYTVRMNCEIEDNNDSKTRGGFSWEDGASVYLNFETNNSSITGKATYNKTTGSWTISLDNPLRVTSDIIKCQAYYFVNPVSEEKTQVSLSENTSVYQGEGTYSHPTTTDIFVTVTLKPKTWRLRFNGNANSQLTIQGVYSDLKYYTKFNINDGSYSSTKKDISLIIGNNGYTPYIYGTFENAKTDNSLTITTPDENVFFRTIDGTKLQSKGSGYLTYPTLSNYSSYGWNIVTATLYSTKFNYNGETKTLNITAPSSYSWQLSSSNSWVSLSRTSGYGNASISLSASANSSSSKRTSILTFKSGNITKTINVSQGYISTLSSYGSFYAEAGDVVLIGYEFSDHTATFTIDINGPVNQRLLSINAGRYNRITQSGELRYEITRSGNYTIYQNYTTNGDTQYGYGRITRRRIIHN